jgi:hypothetical protein
MSGARDLTERSLLTIVSSDGDFLHAVPGLATRLAHAGTVFVPLPAVPRNARAAAPVPSAVIVALDDPAAGHTVGDWLSIYLDEYPAATVTCASGDRLVRLDAAQRRSAPDALQKLLGT